MPDPLPSERTPHPHVVVDPEVMSGSPMVLGTRVPVRRLWAWHRMGVPVDVLVKRYTALGWAKVLCALAWAHDNQDLVEADLARERALLAQEPLLVPGDGEQLRFGHRFR